MDNIYAAMIEWTDADGEKHFCVPYIGWSDKTAARVIQVFTLPDGVLEYSGAVVEYGNRGFATGEIQHIIGSDIPCALDI